MAISGYPLPSTGGGGGGGGLVFGGDWNASGSTVTGTATFTRFTDASYDNDVITPSSSDAVAYADGCFRVVAGTRKLFFDIPAASLFAIGAGYPSGLDFETYTSSGQDTYFVGLFMGEGAVAWVTKSGAAQMQFEMVSGALPLAGQHAELSYNDGTGQLVIQNTDGGPSYWGHAFTGWLPSGAGDFAIVCLSDVPVPVDFDGPSGTTFTQASTGITAYPANRVGKTFRVSAANDKSLLNGNLLLADDFVTFYTAAVSEVSRLYTADELDTAINAHVWPRNAQTISNPANGLYEYVTGKTEVIINITDGVARNTLGLNLADESFLNKRDLLVHINSNATITTFTINYNSQTGEQVSQPINAGDKFTALFRLSGFGYVELVSKRVF